MADSTTSLGVLASRLPEPILVVSADGDIVEANEAAAALLGAAPEALAARPLREFVAADDLQRYLSQCATSPQIVPGRLQLPRIGSAANSFRCEGGLLEPATRERAAVIFLRLRSHHQATERFRLLTDRVEQLGRQVELRMRAEEVLESQRYVLDLIAHEKPLQEIMTALAQSIDRQSAAGARSSVLLLDARKNTLQHAAAPALPPHYCEAIDGLEIGPTVGTCGKAAYTKQIVCTEDIMTDPNWEPYRELARSAGVRACYSTPITGRSDDVLGTFALYYERPREPDADDRRVVSLLARTAALAIERSNASAEIRGLLAREREARAEAEEANRSKDEFLAMVSHELRNPLNAILGWAKVLTMGQSDTDTLNTGLEAIDRNAALQAQLIAEILDYSRITAGKLRLEVTPTDVPELLQTAIDSAQPGADAKKIRLETEIDQQDMPMVALDSSRIQQVVNNLLSNAIKFTPEGGKVTLRAHIAGKHLKLVVEDTGCGIDPKFLPHVFDRFRQQERTQASAHEGLGLGLAIVRHIVELHHGKVHARSDGRGKGARFEVLLPRRFTWRHDRTAEQDDAADLTGLEVLAVEDAADTRSLLRTLFVSAGAQVRLAANGFEALECLDQQHPDVMLCDIGMPGMDGYEVVRRLRLRERDMGVRRRVTAIALTAYARARDRQRALDAGFDAHMAKPIDPGQLLRIVGDCISADKHAEMKKKPAV